VHFSLPLCGHAFRCCVFLIIRRLETRVSSDHSSQFSHVSLLCFVCLKRYSFLLFVVGWSFFSLLHPLLQCFKAHLCSIRTCPNGIRGRWQVWKKVSVHPPSLWPRLLLLCILKTRQLEFHWFIILTRFVIFCVFLETVLFFVVCGGLVFLFFVAPSPAVFQQASEFNQDVSKWNTGAVTRMDHSKCTLSHSL